MSESKAPAASATLAILRVLSRMQRPTGASVIIDETGLPRSTVYQLLKILVDEGFLVRLDGTHRYALGIAAFELGAAFSYHQPLTRLGRPVLNRLVQQTRFSAHVCVLHGRDVLYLDEVRDPSQSPLITDVGVRLPSHLTASGRAILAELPPAQVRALYPDRGAFTTRHGTGPNGPSALMRILRQVRTLGFGFVDDDVTPGISSVASVVRDPHGHPIASVALTFATAEVDRPDDDSPAEGLSRRRQYAAMTAECAHVLEERLHGRRW
ncbi:IclR family transcriptional regulator [Microbacterium sp. Root61]|uniref:IclR family transcriptional regulator n=1 Tax=Microbacterium sp. Root61 TaxID=1736570 RepID=UPI0009E6C8BA|nr:IclR family transcriptional regulator [Microbacterium sp. Root61]